MRRLASVLLAVLALAAVPAASSQLARDPANLPSSHGAERSGLDPRSRAVLARPGQAGGSLATSSSSRSGSRRARPTASRGRCSAPSTRSSPATARTWARARPARSAGCSSCPRPGCAGGWTPTATVIADPWDPEDAVFAAARYLAAAGGRDDIERGIFAYNHAQWYVDDVLGDRRDPRRRALHGGAGDAALRPDRRPRAEARKGAQQGHPLVRRARPRAGQRRVARVEAPPPRAAPRRPEPHRRGVRPARREAGGLRRRRARLQRRDRPAAGEVRQGGRGAEEA